MTNKGILTLAYLHLHLHLYLHLYLHLQRLETFHQIPEYGNYLAYIFVLMPDQDVTVRTVAGLALKTNISRTHATIPPHVIAYVKAHVFAALIDPQPAIRNAAGTIITTMVALFGLQQWPDVLPKLLELMNHPDVKVLEVCVCCECECEVKSN
jgi:hypothetical protein